MVITSQDSQAGYWQLEQKYKHRRSHWGREPEHTLATCLLLQAECTEGNLKVAPGKGKQRSRLKRFWEGIFKREEESFLGYTYHEREIIHGFSAGKKGIDYSRKDQHSRIRLSQAEGTETNGKRRRRDAKISSRGWISHTRPISFHQLTVTSTKTWSSAQPPPKPSRISKRFSPKPGQFCVNMEIVISKPETKGTWWCQHETEQKVVGSVHTLKTNHLTTTCSWARTNTGCLTILQSPKDETNLKSWVL